eukprot:SAG31_NODE_2079_length_6498_cov_3.416159_7_plen_150_part_00
MNPLEDHPDPGLAVPAVFDEDTGRPLNDRARVLIGEEPRGYNECESLDDAIHSSQARAANAPMKTPESLDEWMELLDVLTTDSETPPRPKAVDALYRALTAARDTPLEYVDDIASWLSRRMEHQKSPGMVRSPVDASMLDQSKEWLVSM